jgi:hypothetical protein
MYSIIFCILVLMPQLAQGAAPQNQEAKQVAAQENCLCQDCNKWYRFAQPHPTSQAEKDAASALATLPFAHVTSAGSKQPLLDIVWQYIGDDIGDAPNNQWLHRKTYEKMYTVYLNRGAYLQTHVDAYNDHGNSIRCNYYTNSPIVSLFPRDIIFDDGRCRQYHATYSGNVGVEEHLYNSRDLSLRAESKEVPYFEKISHCNNHKVVITSCIRPSGQYGKPELALRVAAFCRNNVLERIKAHMQTLSSK